MQRYSSLLKTTDEVSAGHYYRSKKGKQLATEICFQITKFLKKKAVKQKNSTKHVVVHTPMPAVTITLPFLEEGKHRTGSNSHIQSPTGIFLQTTRLSSIKIIISIIFIYFYIIHTYLNYFDNRRVFCYFV